MVKIGKFTGKEYTREQFGNIHECIINVDENSEFYRELKVIDYPRPECADCREGILRGCPECQNSK